MRILRFTGTNRFEDYIDILSILGSEISPEVLDSIPLASGRNFRPPFYLEAIKFILSLEKLTSKHWRKFDSLEINSNQPSGQVNWNKYISKEYKVEARLKFPTRKNILSEYHSEYSNLKYVFQLCLNELLSSNTPQKVKSSMRVRLKVLEERLSIHIPIRTKKIKISSSDSPIVRECKIQANKILNFEIHDSTAWRVDFSDVFEKFVQHIFKVAAREIGGKLHTNFRLYSNSPKYYTWEQRQLEPDAIFQKQRELVFIDAKYKSNMYNKYRESELLKEDHRRDLHQILAYSSFSDTASKYGFLCYPSDRIESKRTEYGNRINGTLNTIWVFGIPLKKDIITEMKQLLIKELNRIEFENIGVR